MDLEPTVTGNAYSGLQKGWSPLCPSKTNTMAVMARTQDALLNQIIHFR